MHAYNVALMIKPSSQFQIAYSANYIGSYNMACIIC